MVLTFIFSPPFSFLPASLLAQPLGLRHPLHPPINAFPLFHYFQIVHLKSHPHPPYTRKHTRTRTICRGSASGRRASTFINLSPRNSARDCPLIQEKSQGKLVLKHFYAEMRVLSKLRHPNIITVMGAIMRSTHPMLVMELCDHGR